MEMLAGRNVQVQRLRAFVDARKRSIEAAEKRYDISAAVDELQELCAPLCSPGRFSTEWKQLYLDHFYRDVAAFVLGFVTVHLEVCFSDRDRKLAFDDFFDRDVVPPSKAFAALISTLSATKTKATEAGNKTSEQDAEASVAQCIRLLGAVIEAGGFEDVVADMLEQEQTLAASGGRGLIGHQVLIAQLASLPDLVYNRRQRDIPALFRPRRYFPMLCDALFRIFLQQSTVPERWLVFRLFADKLTRIGQAEAFTQSWMRCIGGPSVAKIHRTLLQSLPESCHEHFLLQLAKEKTPESLSAAQALHLPKYRLLAQVPPELASNKQFQYVLAHKLLLRKPINDLFFWRMLVDVLSACGTDPCESPLASVFDVVLARWGQSDFPTTADYAVNASVCFFLRYSLQKLTENDGGAAFAQRDWIPKLCKGVQDHMSHSLERVRALGMRVGESLSHVIAAEKPLDFGLEDADPLMIYGCPVSTADLEEMVDILDLNATLTREEALQPPSSDGDNDRRRQRRRAKKRTAKPFVLDPDELVLSGDEGGEEESEVDGDSESDASSGYESNGDSDSDMSLEAFDLQDDEEDLTATRPLYLKDLVAGLLADEDREKTEVALAEAENLLRRRPRDIHDKAQEVVRALLRLEDKYSTPHFAKLRAQSLAAACALAPSQTLPYLHSQALEREQLLQSRIDVLQAMTSAAQELSERGAGSQKPRGPKTLLQEAVGSQNGGDEGDLGMRTMQSLKTRRWGYRRDPLAAPKRNAFAPHALEFFSPLLFGYVEYMRKHSLGSDTAGKSRNEVEQTFLAHLLHALASFVECAGHAPQTVAMAKCLLEFAWSERSSSNAEVRRQVLFSVSRVLLVVPPALVRQEMGDGLAEVTPWLQLVQRQDPDTGCREAARLLLSFASVPSLPIEMR